MSRIQHVIETVIIKMKFIASTCSHIRT